MLDIEKKTVEWTRFWELNQKIRKGTIGRNKQIDPPCSPVGCRHVRAGIWGWPKCTRVWSWPIPTRVWSRVWCFVLGVTSRSRTIWDGSCSGFLFFFLSNFEIHAEFSKRFLLEGGVTGKLSPRGGWWSAETHNTQ